MRGSHSFLFLSDINNTFSPSQAQQKDKRNNSSKKDTANNKIDSYTAFHSTYTGHQFLRTGGITFKIL